MNVKKLSQVLFITLIIIVSVFFYYYNLKQSKKNLEQKEEINKTDNSLIQGIKYAYKDESNNTFNITAKYGKKQNTESDRLILYEVYAFLEFEDKQKFEIWADRALYDNFNNYTNFQDNVLLKHNKDKINCNNLELDIVKGFARLKDKIVYSNENAKMFVDIVNIDLKNKKVQMNMLTEEKKIKIIMTNEIN